MRPNALPEMYSVMYLNQIEYSKLALGPVDDEHEEERRVTTIHHAPPLVSVALEAEELLQLWRVEEVAQPWRPRAHKGEDLLHDRLRGLVKGRVEFGQSRDARRIN